MANKKRLKHYAKILGIILLLPGPLLWVFEYSAAMIFWIATALAISHKTAMPQGIPTFPFYLCDSPILSYVGFGIEFIGYLFLCYGLIEKKKSKKNNALWVFIFMTILLAVALFMTMLGVLAACLTF